jgi:hypothetical protein
MEAAKAAVSKFTGRHGHHTDVEEIVNPAVTSETVKPTRHENITQAVDREVHQHHHHTTVQPLQHQEILPEKHSHNMIPVEHREFHHDNESETKERLQLEAAKFKNTTMTHETHHTVAALPAATGEHVHHQVHETVQPIIHKETVHPEVVHTTVPIHETHYGAAQHHGASILPMKTLSEFTSGGGSLTGGKSVTHEEYDGQPRPYNKDLQTEIKDMASLGHHGPSHRQTDSGIGMGTDDRSRTGATGAGITNNGTKGGLGSNTNTATNTTTNTSTSTDEPSLMSRLNPMKDSDHDGKKGFND